MPEVGLDAEVLRRARAGAAQHRGVPEVLGAHQELPLPTHGTTVCRHAVGAVDLNGSVLLADVVATSGTVAATRSRKAKVAAIAALLATAAPDEEPPGTRPVLRSHGFLGVP